MNLSPYIKAGYSILYLVTSEESRADLQLKKTAEENKRNLVVWSATECFATVTDNGLSNQKQIEDPIEALLSIKSGGANTIYIMRDLHMFFNANKIIRLVRDIARDFKQQKKTMIIVSPVKKIPPELERDVTVIEFELPGREDIETTFSNLYEGAQKKVGKLEADEIEKCIQSAMGLTVIEAENAFAKSFVQYIGNSKEGSISKMVMAEKANAVKKSGILEYFDVNTSVKDIGGLENLKEWLAIRSKAFSKAARDFGLPMPRGILLAGLPGCGKSLSAKAASNILGVPLLRFDIGRVFGGLVGESERNMRTAIQTAEAVGNCVLWIDEMEKAFAGMGGSGSTDGGTSQRVFGNFITWMQEKSAPCFIIATVNRIDGLPPELLRKGRFDETFFVGLPSAKERAQIFKIHLQRYGKKLDKFSDKDLEEFVKLSEGFSGAEIEETVVTGLYSAFHHERELFSEDVIKALKTTNPLSRSKAKELEAMAAWAEANAINASKIDKKDQDTSTTMSGRQLDL